MAKTNSATAEAPAETVEKKKRGVAKGTVREKKFLTYGLKWSKDAVNFDPIAALTALAESMNLHVSNVEAKDRESGAGKGKFTLVVSTAPIQKRAKPVMTRDAEKTALAAFKAILRDPEKKGLAEALVARSNAGEDTSAEMAALIGLK